MIDPKRSHDKLLNALFSAEKEPVLWELFNLNSRLVRSSETATDMDSQSHLTSLYESLPYEGYPVVSLPTRLPALSMSLGSAIKARSSIRDITPKLIPLSHLAAILRFGYGVRLPATKTGLGRALRVVPSAGALFPLEIFIHSKHVQGLDQGLYHYSPLEHSMRLLKAGDFSLELSQAVVQAHMPFQSSLMIFLAAMFERTTLKYGDRGYRFVLLEAGHVAQNMNLTCEALGLNCLNIGGFFDSEIDKLLGLDGITQSSIYLIACGKRSSQPAHLQAKRRSNRENTH